MLQKGFLTSNENTPVKKTNKGYYIIGGAICFVLGITLVMFSQSTTPPNLNMQYAGSALIGVGAILMCVGLWMNVMAQSKRHRRKKR